MNKSIIANEAQNLIKGGKDYFQEAWNGIHDDLLEGYYNRKNGLYKRYNPKKYGFKLMKEKDRTRLKEINWKDPIVEDLLNNYDWHGNRVKMMMQVKTKYPKIAKLLTEEFWYWVKIVKEMDEEDE